MLRQPFGFGSEFSRMPPAKLVGMSFGQLWPCRPFLLPVPGTLCRASSSHSSLFLPCAPPALYSGFSHPVSCSPTLQGVLLSTILCFIPTLASDRFYPTLPTPPAINTPRSRFILGWGVDSLGCCTRHAFSILYLGLENSLSWEDFSCTVDF